MGYEELIRDLIREAEAKKEEIAHRGREEARRLIAEAMEQSERMERQFEDTLAREVNRERLTRMNRIQMEGRAVLFQARVSLMEEIFTRLEDRLRRLPQEKHYPRLVEQLYQEILPELPEGNVTIRADAKAMTVLKSLVRGRQAKFEPLPEEEIGGVEISDGAETLRVQNTLKARLLKARPQVMVEINRWLSNP